MLQVKEGFGGLRIHVNHANTAELESSRACEGCGQPGERRESSWIKTLCDEHASERGAGKHG
jgi:hypothetical protein